MTKEPIMIDEVDVSGCCFYEKHYTEDEDVEIKHFCKIFHYHCETEPNCHYKQYKRKEQECEFWGKELDRTHLLMLKKQDELVKEILKNDQLEAEKKELKTCYNNNLKVLRHEEKVNNNLTDRVMKAEQALQEIKELVKKDYCSEIESCEFCAEIGNCINRKILQKCEVIDK